jgi:hypothetical protein
MRKLWALCDDDCQPSVDRIAIVREISAVKTVTADAYLRVRLPNVKPGARFVYEEVGNGTIVLTKVKAQARKPFPRGSLAKYLTSARDKEQLAILQGCVHGPE